MQLKVIKSDIEHEEAMNALMELMDANPEEGSPEANKLEVLATLIEKYEEERFPIDLPDAVEAIRFRMDQQGLTQKDLIPYIGTAARVSEILNRRRPLSLNMIRSLNEGLGIPAAVLIGKAEKLSTSDEYALEWDKFPLKEMHERGCFPSFTGKIADLKTYAEELVQGFLNLLPSRDTAMPALLRSNVHQRSGRPMDRLALYAWQVTVQQQALQQPLSNRYQGIDEAFMQRIVKTSWSDQGPLLAKELLNKQGIHLIIEPHFNKTYLDGAVMLGTDGNPIIGLTARYDRLDNFWFTLLHELSHLHLHLNDETSAFFDDLKVASDVDEVEQEADNLAKQMLIAEEAWQTAGLQPTTSSDAIQHFASELNIHPAIVAGRIQFESGDYHCHRNMLGRGDVMRLFGFG